MARVHVHDYARSSRYMPAGPRTRYVVVRESDAWRIQFGGEQYGPYASEREAMMFAIEAAHALDRRGRATEVLRGDENGDARAEWTSGQDPYPPRR